MATNQIMNVGHAIDDSGGGETGHVHGLTQDRGQCPPICFGCIVFRSSALQITSIAAWGVLSLLNERCLVFRRPSPAAHAGGTGGYVSPTWADWTVLPLVNVVNDALYTGDVASARARYDSLMKYHLYLGWLNGKATWELAWSLTTASSAPLQRMAAAACPR